jgi:hypothetical protein
LGIPEQNQLAVARPNQVCEPDEVILPVEINQSTEG